MRYSMAGYMAMTMDRLSPDSLLCLDIVAYTLTDTSISTSGNIVNCWR